MKKFVIETDKLAANAQAIQDRAGVPVIAVLKADGYGFGMLQMAKVLSENGITMFAVTEPEDALTLRENGYTSQLILVMRSTAMQDEAEIVVRANATATIGSPEAAAALSAAAQKLGTAAKAHLKLDTGMGRIGFAVRTAAELDAALPGLTACYALPGLEISGVFQHFAVADSETAENERYTEQQHALFTAAVERLRAADLPTGTVHCANSAAQMRRPEWRCDMVRAGIILYGLDPSEEVHFAGLRPVMTLKTVVSHVKTLHPGESVSYGRTFEAPQEMRVATVCVGYADGYPRLLSGTQGQGLMLVNGHPAPVLGRVCMDQTLVDVTNIPGVTMGDEVVVFGPHGADTADSIARKTGTINYEVVCGVARRVPRVYLKNNEPTEIWNDLEDK